MLRLYLLEPGGGQQGAGCKLHPLYQVTIPVGISLIVPCLHFGHLWLINSFSDRILPDLHLGQMWLSR